MSIYGNTPHLLRGGQIDRRSIFGPCNLEGILTLPVTIPPGFGFLPAGTTMGKITSEIGATRAGQYVPYTPQAAAGGLAAALTTLFGAAYLLADPTNVATTLEVTMNDVDRAGEIVDLAVANGANKVNRFAFTLSDAKQQEFRSQALTAAVAQARGDADAVAAAIGKTILDVKEVNVGGSYVPMAYDNRYSGMEKPASGAAPTPLEVGEIDVTATVSISYVIS